MSRSLQNPGQIVPGAPAVYKDPSEKKKNMIRNTNFMEHNRLHLNLSVDDRSPRPGISELLKKLRPEWNPEEIQIKASSTPQMLASDFCCKGPVLLVRVYGQMTELFMDREKEMEMFQLLHTHGCGPELYCSFSNGICYEFIPGVVLDDALLREPSVYRLIASEMGKIHSINRAEMKSDSAAEPVLWSRLSRFLTLLQGPDELQSLTHAPESGANNPLSSSQGQTSSISLFTQRHIKERTISQRSSCFWKRETVLVSKETPSLNILIEELEELKNLLTLSRSQVVLCHNDLLTKNVIYNREEDQVKFIDYEYADYNYQAYDIGNHFNEFAGISTVDSSLFPSTELRFDWLASYLESFKRCSGESPSVTKEELQELHQQVCQFSLVHQKSSASPQVAHLFWCLWALLQAKHSSIDFDFQRRWVCQSSIQLLPGEEAGLLWDEDFMNLLSDSLQSRVYRAKLQEVLESADVFSDAVGST
ncbi:hypothetical protein DNTS_015392 [Danionella cerebrum]|uniref:ethanolamine kinase n=1 Tax=Danionella cerebrum TaxID=2873325 RepID=A0A553REM2_9TELE|nr:hypothetical protein DNTS_015392 [Danionella translucida]